MKETIYCRRPVKGLEIVTEGDYITIHYDGMAIHDIPIADARLMSEYINAHLEQVLLLEEGDAVTG